MVRLVLTGSHFTRMVFTFAVGNRRQLSSNDVIAGEQDGPMEVLSTQCETSDDLATPSNARRQSRASGQSPNLCRVHGRSHRAKSNRGRRRLQSTSASAAGTLLVFS
jgi:hypothetical protein